MNIFFVKALVKLMLLYVAGITTIVTVGIHTVSKNNTESAEAKEPKDVSN